MLAQIADLRLRAPMSLRPYVLAPLCPFALMSLCPCALMSATLCPASFCLRPYVVDSAQLHSTGSPNCTSLVSHSGFSHF